MVTGLCFFVSVFFVPIFASIPPWATGPTLILVSGLRRLSPSAHILTESTGRLHDGSTNDSD
jgi:xanthine/uracil/vitamin C permease (AzgA family)